MCHNAGQIMLNHMIDNAKVQILMGWTYPFQPNKCVKYERHLGQCGLRCFTAYFNTIIMDGSKKRGSEFSLVGISQVLTLIARGSTLDVFRRL